MFKFTTAIVVVYLLMIGYNYLDAVRHGALANNPKTVISFGIIWLLVTAGVIACFIWLLSL